MIDSFLSALNRYPALATLAFMAVVWMAWTIGSAVFISIYDKRAPHSDAEWKEALERHSFWWAVYAVIKATGGDPPMALRAARRAAGGPLPTWLRFDHAPINRAELEKMVEAAAHKGAAAALEISRAQQPPADAGAPQSVTAVAVSVPVPTIPPPPESP